MQDYYVQKRNVQEKSIKGACLESIEDFLQREGRGATGKHRIRGQEKCALQIIRAYGMVHEVQKKKANTSWATYQSHSGTETIRVYFGQSLVISEDRGLQGDGLESIKVGEMDVRSNILCVRMEKVEIKKEMQPPTERVRGENIRRKMVCV